MDPGIGMSELRKGENSKSLMLQYETSERQKTDKCEIGRR